MAISYISYEHMQITGFDVDDFLVDLYFYFDKSTKRKAELAGIQYRYHNMIISILSLSSNHFIVVIVINT